MAVCPLWIRIHASTLFTPVQPRFKSKNGACVMRVYGIATDPSRALPVKNSNCHDHNKKCRHREREKNWASRSQGHAGLILNHFTSLLTENGKTKINCIPEWKKHARGVLSVCTWWLFLAINYSDSVCVCFLYLRHRHQHDWSRCARREKEIMKLQRYRTLRGAKSRSDLFLD